MYLTTVKVIRQTFLFNPVELKLISNREVPTEHEEQRAFVSWFKKSTDTPIFAIPNGGGRSKTEGSRLKNEGVSPGVPDLFIPGLCLWIEFKRTKGGSLSQAQKDWHESLEKFGYTVLVPRGASHAVEIVTKFIERNSFESD